MRLKGFSFASTLFSLLFCFSLQSGIAQNKVSIAPAPEAVSVCPGVSTTYTITGWNAGCHSITVTNATTGSTPTVSSGGVFATTWADNGMKGGISITKSTATNCSSAKNGDNFTVNIRTLFSVTPSIAGPASFPVGTNGTGVYTATLDYPFKGTTEMALPVTAFTWTVPTGWANNTIPITASSIAVGTNISTGGNITATGMNTLCPSAFISLLTIKPVTRFMPAPCPIIGLPPFVLCTNTTAFTATATVPTGNFSTGGGIVYTWTTPTTWTSNGTLNNSIGLVPDGSSGGTVTVTAKSFGLTSTPCTGTIALKVIDPAAVVNGPGTICTNGSFNLSIPPPTAVGVSWVVTNLSQGGTPPVSPVSGTGNTAALSATSGNANCRITFTIGTAACGFNTLTKDFFVGKPRLYNPKVDNVNGSVQTVCPGSHTASLSVEGGNSSCVTWTNSSTVLGFAGCTTFDMQMPVYNGPCATLKAVASNLCGNNDVQ